jgi:hypothetical protein
MSGQVRRHSANSPTSEACCGRPIRLATGLQA